VLATSRVAATQVSPLAHVWNDHELRCGIVEIFDDANESVRRSTLLWWRPRFSTLPKLEPSKLSVFAERLERQRRLRLEDERKCVPKYRRRTARVVNGCSICQRKLLEALLVDPRVNRAANRLGILSSHLSYTVAVLEQRGWIEVDRGVTPRVAVVTQGGRQKLAESRSS
jgi:hypothetical protein